MNTPPLLLGATLLFWGWQAGLLWVGAVMAVALESPRLVKARWEVSDEDLSRIWTFCSLLFMVVAVYAFTANEGPSHFGSFFQNPNASTSSRAGAASARTAASLFRWLPMTFFLFVAAQAWSSRREIPLTAISLIMRRRKRREKPGSSEVAHRGINVAYPYFGVCLFAASNHPADNSTFFWGSGLLIGWALFSQRPRRFRTACWVGAFSLAIALGYFGQRGIGRLQNYLSDLNPQWLAFLRRPWIDPVQSRTSLGHIGRLKESRRIVIRLWPVSGEAPTYLREASYSTYESRGSVWVAGKDFYTMFPQTNGTSWLLLPDKTNTAEVQIASYLEGVSRDTDLPMGLLPLPAGVSRLDNLPAYVVRTNSAGAVLAEGPGLVVFDACYGPGASFDSPPNAYQDCDVPPHEWPALDQTISQLPLAGKSTSAKLRVINSYFQSHFTYSTWQRRPRTTGTNQTPVSRFLLDTKSGHCEYFATATVLLLRRLHIPARYAVGYTVHERSGSGYVVRERDAHAWCLVWNADAHVWQDFDTTPASLVNEEAKRASPFQWLADRWSWIKFQYAKFRWGQTRWRQYLLWGLVPVLAMLLYRIIFWRGSRVRRQSGKGLPAVIRHGLDSEFYLVERILAQRAVARRTNEPLTGWLERVSADPALQELWPSVLALLSLHYRYRFDPRGLSDSDRERLRSEANACLQALRRLPFTQKAVRQP